MLSLYVIISKLLFYRQTQRKGEKCLLCYWPKASRQYSSVPLYLQVSPRIEHSTNDFKRVTPSFGISLRITGPLLWTLFSLDSKAWWSLIQAFQSPSQHLAEIETKITVTQYSTEGFMRIMSLILKATLWSKIYCL